jgi:hypothetical protein
MNINLSPIKYRLEAMTCPEHKQHATVSMEVGRIEINACCETYRRSLEAVANQEYARALDAGVVDILDQAPSSL